MTTGKTIALTTRTFLGKIMSLLFNMLSRLVITFLPRSKSLNFMAAVTICSDFGAQKNSQNLMLRKIEGKRRREWQRMRWLDDGHEFEQALGVGDEQGRLACCSPWGLKDTTEWMNNSNNLQKRKYIQYDSLRLLPHTTRGHGAGTAYCMSWRNLKTHHISCAETTH